MSFAFLKAILPFLKELLFGDSDVRQQIRRNKLATFFIMANASMFILFIFVSEQVLKTRVELNQKKQHIVELETTLSQLQTQAEQSVVECEPTQVIQEVAVIPPVKPNRRKQPAREPVPQPIPNNDLKGKLNAIRNEEEEL